MSVLSELAPGSRVIATPGCSTPTTLLGALAADGRGVELNGGLFVGELPFLDAVEAGTLRYRTWHVPAAARRLVRAGVVDYVPLRAADVPRVIASNTYDALLLRVTPPDRDGYCSFGPSGTYTRVALERARRVVAEIDERLPRTCGDTLIHRARIDALIESDTDTPMYESAPRSEVADAIARRIVELIPRDPTLQVGIGAIPEALAGFAAEADLGRVRVAGLTIDRHVALAPVHIHAVELMGTRTILDYAHGNDSVEVIPTSQCHDPRWLATLPRLVSVNTAVEIDVFGQVASETIGGEVIAGIGGSVDFFEGASWSEGGLRVLALASTTPDGKVSKIVRRLAAGTPVTIPRHGVDVVVTEHGVARLFGLSLRERAEALIAIAAPQFRDRLSEEA